MDAGDLLGRETELAAIDAFLEWNQTGGAGALVLEGEPGIGKTALWREGLRRAGARGIVVLSCHPAETETKLSFSALADLLEGVEEEFLAELPEPQRSALEIALLRCGTGSSPVEPRAVAAGFRGIVTRLGKTSPVVIAIDDAQWLDRSSAFVLQYVMRRIDTARVAVFATRREHEERRGLAIPDGESLELGPLSLAATHELLRRQLGRSLRRPLLVRVHETAGGNPFFALELVRSMPADLAAGSHQLPMPDNLRQLVLRRIRRLGAESRAMLLAAAALPAPTVELVAFAVDATPGAVVAVLEHAEEAGVVALDQSEIRFRHPLFAAGVYSAATPAQRRRIHRRLAQTVEGLEERARHLALSTEGVNEANALILDEAAESARGRGAPDAAAELADYARRLTPPRKRSDVLRRTIKVAEYQFRAGELREAREALVPAVPLAEDDRLRADALRLLGEITFNERSFVEAIGLFEQALELTDNDALRAMVEVHLAFARNASGDFLGAQEHARRALLLAEPLGAEGGFAEALAVATITDFQLGEGLDESRIARALELEDPGRHVTAEMRPSFVAGCLMLYVGRLRDSARILGGLRDLLVERGEESDLPYVSSHIGWAECWLGNVGAAGRFCAEAVESARQMGSDSMCCLSLAFAAVRAAYAGDADTTRAQAAECEQLASKVGFHIGLWWANWAIALLALSRGDANAAAVVLTPLLPPFEERPLPEPILGFFLPDAVEALVLTGELERAERVLQVFEEAATRTQRPWALMAAWRCRALLDSAAGRSDRAAAAATAAVAVGERLELRLEFARTLLVAGQIERRLRRKKAAREVLQRAHELFESSGAQLWAEKARDELDRVGLRRAAAGELTQTEQRVAQLAASGMTNREVAAQLFMSPKTVEANLAHAYRKLGISSRAELGARLGADKPAAQT